MSHEPALPALRRTLAHTGWLVSGLSLAAIWLVLGGPSAAAPLAAAAEVVCRIGAAVGVGIGWTLAQAAIHTRLGSRQMLPDIPSGPSAISMWRVLGVTVAIVVGVSLVELSDPFTRELLLQLWIQYSPLHAVQGALHDVLRGLGRVVLVGAGLAFGAELAWCSIRDRLSARTMPQLSDRHL